MLKPNAVLSLKTVLNTMTPFVPAMIELGSPTIPQISADLVEEDSNDLFPGSPSNLPTSLFVLLMCLRIYLHTGQTNKETILHNKIIYELEDNI